MILVTSLPAKNYSTDDVLALYRLRWRIELAFKRLKSLIGLKAPPGVDERSAKPYVLAHLLVILLLEPLIDEFEELSLLGTSRLTRPGAWRLLLQLAGTLLQAIMPQPSLADLRRAKDKLRRDLHEPPRRRREYQKKDTLILAPMRERAWEEIDEEAVAGRIQCRPSSPRIRMFSNIASHRRPREGRDPCKS